MKIQGFRCFVQSYKLENFEKAEIENSKIAKNKKWGIKKKLRFENWKENNWKTENVEMWKFKKSGNWEIQNSQNSKFVNMENSGIWQTQKVKNSESLMTQAVELFIF